MKAKSTSKGIDIHFRPPVYSKYVVPDGYLTSDMACQALWHYYLSARITYEKFVQKIIVFEGEPDPQVNFQQLFTSIAMLYGVAPESMIKFWSNIDAQCIRLHLPKLPDSDEFRFNKVPEIRTQ